MTQSDWQDLQRTVRQMTRLEKLQLIDRIAQTLGTGPPAGADQRTALQRIRSEMASLPVCNPTDGWSNRQHDHLLYGEDAR